MNKRPLSITILSWIFIVFVGIGLLSHLVSDIQQAVAPGAARTGTAYPVDFWLILAVRILGVLGGVFMLRGWDCARWLLVVWLAAHVIISIHHSTFELVLHCVLFVVIAYFLFRPQASAYFRGPRPDAAQNPNQGERPPT
jgi:hypothetical protein